MNCNSSEGRAVPPSSFIYLFNYLYHYWTLEYLFYYMDCNPVLFILLLKFFRLWPLIGAPSDWLLFHFDMPHSFSSTSYVYLSICLSVCLSKTVNSLILPILIQHRMVHSPFPFPYWYFFSSDSEKHGSHYLQYIYLLVDTELLMCSPVKTRFTK